MPSDNEDRVMQYFVPFSQVPLPPFAGGGRPRPWGLLLRVGVPLETLAPTIRRLVVAGRTDLPFIRIRYYTELLERQLRPWRLGTTLLGLFSTIALCVAALGLYAAFAHAVFERRHEMAVRIAIGAQPRSVVRMILRESFLVAGAGVVLGSLTTLAAGRWVESLLFDTTPSDPIVLAFAGTVMVAAACGATLGPARAASQADPSRLLRVE